MGGWSVNVGAHGYRSQAYNEHDGFSTAVILTETNPVYELTFRLTPGGGIEGFVLDEAGDAVRNAQLTASLIPAATPDDLHPRRQNRGEQRTDDRGFYRFSGLASGNYEIKVQAQPWYAINGLQNRQDENGNAGGEAGASTGGESIGSGASSVGSEVSSLNLLDVVYPVVWYPGVTDFSAATPIAISGGETKQANFRLLPVPGFHLHLSSGLPLEGGGGVDIRQLLPDGTETPVPTVPQRDGRGILEFSGLAPGNYAIHRHGESESPGTAAATIRIAPNSARTVDLSEAAPAIPAIIRIDPEADKPSLLITFRNVETGHVSFVQSRSHFDGGSQRWGALTADGRNAAQTVEDPTERTISLQPGRYEVTLNGINDLHLSSVEAKGATAIGRTVTIIGGSPTLTLHVASGRVNVAGFVRSHGRPVEGAMVLLVPATLGDLSGINVTRRDQSNTDGSFDLPGVLPGAYILVAIDHGWDVSWSETATLRRFLVRGVPLDLSAAGNRTVTIEAQSP